MVKSKLFDNLIILVIVGNTITLSMDFYEMPDSLTEDLAVANIIFSTAFGLEMALKLIGTRTRL